MKLNKLVLLAGILGFSAFAQASVPTGVAPQCTQILADAAVYAATVDITHNGVDINTVSQADLAEHAERVDLPVIYEVYKQGADAALSGVTRVQAHQQMADLHDNADNGELTSDEAETMFTHYSSTFMCGFDAALNKL